MLYKCIVIDDEPDSVEIINDYIQQIPELVVLQSYIDPVKAMADMAQGDPVDFVFMDIDMPRISGLELSRAIRSKTNKLIFTTAHTKYAFEAFEVEADAYLLKPFTFAKFALAINKLLNDNPRVRTEDNSKEFYVKTTEERNRFVRIKFDEVIAIESVKNYIKIYTTTEEIMTYLTLKEIKERFDETDDFIQIHRSFIISKNYIEKVEGSLVKLPKNMLIPIGTFYKDAFYDYLLKNTIKTGRNN
ncbi:MULTISPECIES: LytR/AlgR family response regulator transcription factor [Olivibacter]|jgi:DNA-binding LytR/AlgR family response regulator|uniref:LytR/AlgR family response regulator transcription factor n=2 Tax=Olivibacter TaxID=376469 RepID=A0ABV6HE79_9SPHI|nr:MULTISPECIES: LytTR family DNA-binding domain-containing protein [Olivibacter]MCL4642313.1 LytTR family DNA-binding domain-containing protein [Olivibacter sp. UJ_SKK_5.1]MDM8177728.1 LytTR family DNA-binding domain-containing protein [Olivibacter sp. 47]MDX3911956.1 LytTR family DNA-binding domain-containing protein [Pseudosphingobacterium sp.]